MHLSAIFPFSVFDAPWLAPVALLLDLWLGDPGLPWPHPVCLVGRLQNWLEAPCRRFMNKYPQVQQLRGRLAGGAALLFCLLAVAMPMLLALRIPVLGVILAVWLAWSGLAMGCLLETGRLVLERVESAPLAQAREGVGWLVSRDISALDRQMLRKTLADTLSENFTDAFMAPFFWLTLTGPVGLWAYKTVSTMDSQWGYLTPEWRDLGFCGAKGDDLLAWLPARLSALALWLTDAMLWPAARRWGGSWPGLRMIRRQAKGMPSPNSGWSMAACAWLCGCRMAGSSVYFGRNVFKPWLGPPAPLAGQWHKASLLALCDLMRKAAMVGGMAFWLFCLGAGLICNQFS